MSLSPSNKKHSKRRFSKNIEKILTDCSKLQDRKLKSAAKNIETHISAVKTAFQELRETDLDPLKFLASQAYHNGKTRLEAYLEEKNRVKKTLNKNCLKYLLHEQTLKNDPKKLSFNCLEQEDTSFLVTQNKRKFGETYKNKFNSAQVSPVFSNLPSIKNSPKLTPKLRNERKNLNEVISSMIEKDLGLLSNNKTVFIQKKKTLKRNKRKASIKPRKLSISQEKCEAIYLGADFNAYKQNIENSLKIERLLVKQHAKERRTSMALVNLEKKNNNEDKDLTIINIE